MPIIDLVSGVKVYGLSYPATCTDGVPHLVSLCENFLLGRKPRFGFGHPAVVARLGKSMVCGNVNGLVLHPALSTLTVVEGGHIQVSDHRPCISSLGRIRFRGFLCSGPCIRLSSLTAKHSGQIHMGISPFRICFCKAECFLEHFLCLGIVVALQVPPSPRLGGGEGRVIVVYGLERTEEGRVVRTLILNRVL